LGSSLRQLVHCDQPHFLSEHRVLFLSANQVTDSEKLALAIKTLESVLNGCLHPDIALVRVITPMQPIRETLKKIKS